MLSYFINCCGYPYYKRVVLEVELYEEKIGAYRSQYTEHYMAFNVTYFTEFEAINASMVGYHELVQFDPASDSHNTRTMYGWFTHTIIIDPIGSQNIYRTYRVHFSYRRVCDA